jgi:hypothetical protein
MIPIKYRECRSTRLLAPTNRHTHVTLLMYIVGVDECAQVARLLRVGTDCVDHLHASITLNHLCIIFGSFQCEYCFNVDNVLFDLSTWSMLNQPFVQYMLKPRVIDEMIVCVRYYNFSWIIVGYNMNIDKNIVSFDDSDCLTKTECHYFSIYDKTHKSYLLSFNPVLGYHVNDRLSSKYPNETEIVMLCVDSRLIFL